MPNAFAHLVFYSWPLVVYVIFRKQALVPALIWSVFAGYMLLPGRIGLELPLLPTIGKDQMVTISAAVMCYVKLMMDRTTPAWDMSATDGRSGSAVPCPPKDAMGRAMVWTLILIVLTTPLITVLGNSEPIIAGPTYIPGLRLYDALSMIAGSLFTLLPFVLGWRFLNTAQSHVIFLKVMCCMLVVYSIPALWEIRMSPHLNIQIYGFRPSAFVQHVRAGGYRPLVFLNHGLMLGLLLAMAILAAAVLWRHFREEAKKSGIWILCICWLSLTLFLSKNLGASIITVALLPVVMLMKVRGQMLVAAILSGVVLIYPMLRGAGYIPVYAVHDYIEERNPERAQSFKFRLDHEETLLEKANEKPVLGWGSWGRNMVYDEVTGENLSVTDGTWIIIIGVFGWVGYIGYFGLLTVPLILLALRRRRLEIPVATSGLGLILAANLFDLIPNSGLSPMTWLTAGSMMGYFATAIQTARHPQTARTDAPRAEVAERAPDDPAAPQARTRRTPRAPTATAPLRVSRHTPEGRPENSPRKARKRS